MPPDPGVLTIIVQGGSFALVAWLFVYWMPRLATSVNLELRANRDAVDKIVDRTLLERKEDRDARHALAERFNTALLSMFVENSKQSDKVTEAIRIQTDRLATKMDVMVVGVLKANVIAADKLKQEKVEA